MRGFRSRRSATRSTAYAGRRGSAGSPRAPSRPTAERSGTDDRLALLFACCHPALAPEARLALTLRAVVGLTTPQIARAFLVNETTLAQRIVRAKRKIVTAGISLAVPAPAELTERLGDVLAVVYVMFNEGFVSSTGATQDRDLAADAVWLAEVVATSLPREAEAWGLAALLTIQHARAAARFDASGGLVLLRDQDRSRWDRAALDGRRGASRARGRAALPRPLPAPGRDRRLSRLQPVVGGDRLAADRHAVRPAARPRPLAGAAPQPSGRAGPAGTGPGRQQALADVDRLAGQLAGYHLFHATRAELLDELGRSEEAADGQRPRARAAPPTTPSDACSRRACTGTR